MNRQFKIFRLICVMFEMCSKIFFLCQSGSFEYFRKAAASFFFFIIHSDCCLPFTVKLRLKLLRKCLKNHITGHLTSPLFSHLGPGSCTADLIRPEVCPWFHCQLFSFLSFFSFCTHICTRQTADGGVFVALNCPPLLHLSGH